jgi:ATP-dependent RNA helicase RhlE
MTHFSDLWLDQKFLDALETLWYTTPSPIQAQAIPPILWGKDVFGCAQTGTGKTAAFSLPMLQLLDQEVYQTTLRPEKYKRPPIRALILTPTRELAIQIGESINDYWKNTTLTNTVIFGGVSQVEQVKKLRKWVDILVATPGRLLDLINQKFIRLSDIQIFVLDEADRMLDMGFIHDIKKVIALLPRKNRQTLFFSATMAPTIMNLANGLLTNPVHISVTPVSSTVDTVTQSLYTVRKEDKKNLLLHLLDNPEVKSAVVFTKTKHGANKVEKILAQAKISSAAIHGNKSQTARQKALASLKSWSIRVLVATDIAARGIDIDELSHVIIHDVPLEPESYVHRIGRTGRAWLSGHAMMFCDEEEVKYLRQVTKLIGKEIPLIINHPYHADIKEGTASKKQSSSPKPKKKFYPRKR